MERLRRKRFLHSANQAVCPVLTMAFLMPGLQVAVDEEIHRVRFEEQIVDVRTGTAGVDRFLPQA